MFGKKGLCSFLFRCSLLFALLMLPLGNPAYASGLIDDAGNPEALSPPGYIEIILSAGIVISLLLAALAALYMSKKAKSERTALLRAFDASGSGLRVLSLDKSEVLYFNGVMLDAFGERSAKCPEAPVSEPGKPNNGKHFYSADPNKRFSLRSAVIPWTRGGKAILEIYSDVTKHVEALERLELFESIINACDDFIAATDRDLSWVYGNPGAYAMSGYSREEIGLDIGPDRMFDPETAARIKDACVCAMEKGCWTGESELIRKDGSRLDVQQIIFAIFDSDRNATGIGTIIRDITDIKAAHRDISDAKERLEIALSSSRAGVWELDLVCNTAVYDTNTAILFGLDKNSDHIDSLSFISKITPVISMSDSLEDILNIMQSPDQAVNDYKLVSGDGAVRYVNCYGRYIGNSAQERAKFIGMTIEITDRIKLEDELRLAKEAAESASSAKSQFLSNVSHELRTPMNAIIGMTRIAENSDDLDKIKENLAKVESSSAHLLGIINDILDLSSIESGKFELILKSFDFEKILADLIREISLQCEKYNLFFCASIGDNVPRQLKGDPSCFVQVIRNLISNAVKFTSLNGRIDLAVSALSTGFDSTTIGVSVADTGIGMTPEQQERLFQSFEQADSGITKKFGGTGLGLSISKRIIEMMGGTISVSSKLGSGSKFEFTANFQVLDTAFVDPSVCGDKKQLPSSATDAMNGLNGVTNPDLDHYIPDSRPQHSAPDAAPNVSNTSTIGEPTMLIDDYQDYISFPKGLKLLNNNLKLYVKLLGSFADGSSLSDLTAAVEAGDTSAALGRLHAIKGVSANLALVKINSLAVSIEEAVKEQNSLSETEYMLEELVQAYDKTLAIIRRAMDNPDIILEQ